MAELVRGHHRRWAPATYGVYMQRPPKIIVLSAAGVMALLMVAVIVSAVIGQIPDPPAQKVGLPEQALTPEEMTLTVTPHTDGTLHVAERLIFDVPEGKGRPLFWSIGSESIGWERGVGDGQQYFVLPQVTDVSAKDLSTAEDSTKDDPAEVGDLIVARDDSDVEDPDYDDVGYEFTNPNPPNENSQWAKGRHVVDFAYVLDDVYLTVGGHELFVLPLRFPHGSSEAESIRTISLESDGPIRCLSDNRRFDLGQECSATHLGDDGQTMTWREDDKTGSLAAIGFEPPEDMRTEPIDAHEQGRAQS